MGGGIFGFVMGAAAAFLFMKAFRRASVKQIKAHELQLEPDQKLQGAMRAIDEISAVMGKLSGQPAQDSDANGKFSLKLQFGS